MNIKELYNDWREYAWEPWRRQRRGEQPPNRGAARSSGFVALQLDWFFEDLPKLRDPSHRRHPSGCGWLVSVPKGYYCKLDWDAARAKKGVEAEEKLYYGFDTKFPEVKVPDHHQRRRPGTPVYVDDVPLYRRMWFQDGEMVTREQLFSEIDDEGDQTLADSEGEDVGVPASVIKQIASTGSSIYDRDAPGGDEELALNILNDFYGDENLALQWYEAFAQDVVSRLAHVRLQPTFSCVDAEDAFEK